MPFFAAFAAVAPEMLAIDAAAAAAAEIAAAEAATVAAAEAAAATAAQQAAAATAAQTAATTASAGPAGIMELGNAAANAPLTSEAVNAAAQQANAGIQGLPQGFDQQLQNIQNMSQGPSVQVASNAPGAGLDSLQTSSNISDAAMRAGTNPSIPSNITNEMLSSGYTPAPPAAPSSPFNYSGPVEQGTPHPMMRDAYTTPLPDTRSSLMKGLDSATDWAKKNPFTAMTGAYGAANMLGLMKPSGETFNDKEYDGPLNKYRLSDNFQAGSANPQDFQYTPRRYALGGVMDAGPVQAMSDQNNMQEYQRAMTATGGQVASFAKGGSLSDSIDSYQRMLSGKPMEPPARSADVGIYYDQDPDTRYQDPLTAAQIRQAKVNQRAYVSPPVAKRPTPMGQLQMASVKPRKQGGGDVEAASGGIMHSSLGGYAAGGNPRLLKGPGDGMSDNIPATINGRQPARLADGEFVIPADVVSHLGNGSTEAGAKQLHAMMDKVRKARTGNPKQGKNIRPQKYMPK